MSKPQITEDLVPAIRVQAQPRKPILVDLGGQRYMAIAPKGTLAMSLMMQIQMGGEDPKKVDKALNRLLKDIFGAEDGPKVRKRLDDEKDSLDLPHVMTLTEQLMEYANSGDPTGSPSA